MVSGINGKTSAIEFFFDHKSSIRSCCYTVPKREQSCLSKRLVHLVYLCVCLSIHEQRERDRECHRDTNMEREGGAFRKRDRQTVRERVRETVTDRQREEENERGDRDTGSVFF